MTRYATDAEVLEREVRALRRELRLTDNERLRVAHDRDRWIRLFNRLEAAISHHKKALGYEHDDMFEPWDEALYKARDKILRDAAQSSEHRSDTAHNPADSAPISRKAE